MEFKKTLVAALEYLASSLREVAGTPTGVDPVRIRLEEVILLLNADSPTRENDRRVKLASAYAARVLAENGLYPRSRPVEEVIHQVITEAENLEKIWFRFYSVDGEPKTMRMLDIVDCSLGKSMSPLHSGRSAFTCRKEETKCAIARVVKTECFTSLVAGVQRKQLHLRSKPLRDALHSISALLEGGEIEEGRAIGQRMCFPLADAVIVSKAVFGATGLFTADHDQVSMSERMGIRCLFFDSARNEVIICRTQSAA
jgi:hypothetical protein